MKRMNEQTIKIALAQYSPVWMRRVETIEKVARLASDAADGGCNIAVIGGECSVGGYPYWLELTGGAVFNSQVQKEIFAEYSNQAVQVERGDLQPLCEVARTRGVAVYIGIVEKPADRGETLYASLVFIDAGGNIASVHRKLIPTYEERLVWGIGDGNGLRVHRVGPFTVGGLNCWENWNPLIRSALYAQGEDFHVCVFPGGTHNSELTRFIAKESRSYVASVCCVMRSGDIHDSVPHREKIIVDAGEYLSNGGTCLAGPDGEWIIEPIAKHEELLIAEIDHTHVREERQNFDPTGHYSRPDVLRLSVDRTRQTSAIFNETNEG